MGNTVERAAGPEWPASMQELDPAEHLAVWAFRRWASGLSENSGRHWSLVWNEFRRRLGGICRKPDS